MNAKNKFVEYKPWGYYEVLSDKPTHKVKKILVHPHKRLSLQFHRHRSEHWFIVIGTGLVIRGNQ